MTPPGIRTLAGAISLLLLCACATTEPPAYQEAADLDRYRLFKEQGVLERELEELLKTYLPAHPAVVAQKAKIETIALELKAVGDAERKAREYRE